jgi:hypothetical protein
MITFRRTFLRAAMMTSGPPERANVVRTVSLSRLLAKTSQRKTLVRVMEDVLATVIVAQNSQET